MPKDDEAEGCGISPLIFRGWPKAVCNLHDRLYVKGSWAQENLTRKEADDHFLLSLLTVAGRNPLKRMASYVMYGAVRLFGGPFWEGKK